MALEKLEPTPENYLKAYHAEAGTQAPENPAAPPPAPGAPEADAAAAGRTWADLIDRVVRGLERSSKQWTTARRKDSIKRVLEGSGSHPERLQQRLRQLVGSWDGEGADPGASAPMPLDAPVDAAEAARSAETAPSAEAASSAEAAPPADARLGRDLIGLLSHTVEQALPGEDEPAREAAAELARLRAAAVAETPLPELGHAFEQACEQARLVLQHRRHLFDQVGALCRNLTESLADLSEDDSWVRGQCVVMRHQLEEGLNARGVRRIGQLLADTRERQRRLRTERDEAKRALQALIHQMLQELAELGGHTDRFQNRLGEYAQTIGQAPSLESLADVVREMVAESRSVQALVSAAQARLHTEHTRATALSERVRELEDEIRKLSDEVSTDPLTQVANRRGLLRAFEAERARADRGSEPLAVGLIDIDNFKRLNDQLGHQTGDEALKFLTDRVARTLRPTDVLARYGGEEFVVLLPGTGLEEAQATLTRVQRAVSAELFLQQDEQKVFITFSAGVTLYRADESIEAALDRADVALYEAKRTGKNRTCVAP